MTFPGVRRNLAARRSLVARRSLAAIAAALCLSASIVGAGAVAPAGGAETFTPEQRGAIEGIIKEYLIKNPEVLQEAIGELERRQADAQRTDQRAALAALGSTLATSTTGSVIGNPAGDVTLVEFFDYNCPYCKRALIDLRALIKGDPKLRVVLRDLPVLGPDSVEATKVALAAKLQLSGDKLLEYHARLLETRGRVGGERGIAVAKEMGLDVARLQRDMAGPEVAAAMAENTAVSEKLALTGTPAFIVGNEIISGAVGVDPLRQAIAATRKCGNAVC